QLLAVPVDLEVAQQRLVDVEVQPRPELRVVEVVDVVGRGSRSGEDGRVVAAPLRQLLEAAVAVDVGVGRDRLAGRGIVEVGRRGRAGAARQTGDQRRRV